MKLILKKIDTTVNPKLFYRCLKVYDSIVEHKSVGPIIKELSLTVGHALYLFELAIFQITLPFKYDPEFNHEKERKSLLSYHGFEDYYREMEKNNILSKGKRRCSY